MSTYKINAEVNFGSNISKLVNQINSEVKKISAIKIGVNKNDINQIKAAIGGISSSFNSIGRNNNLSRSINDISRAAKTGSRDFKLLSSSIANSHNELEKFGRSTGATIRRFSAFVGVVTIFNGIKDAFRDSAKEAINFEKEMIKVAQVTGFAFKDLGDLDREITRLSTTLGVSSSKLLNVSLTLAQAGITAKDTKKALDVLAKTELSATFTNIQDTTEAAIAVIAQFGTTTSDLEKQLGVINTVSAKFAVESGDLTTAIRKAGGAFQATGGDLNELIALFTSVRATTRESADAIATGLRTIFTRLQRPRTLNFLEELGITLRNDAGEFIGVYQAVEKLSGALKNISGTDPRFNQIVEELGGFRQVSRVIPLLKEFETSQKALAAAQRAGNSVNDDAITAQKSLANQIARVKEEFNALVRSILNDTAFRKTTEFVLGLASAFIKVADSVRPLIPLLAIAGTAFTIKNTGSFIGGVRKELFDVKEAVKTIGPRKGFNRGGLVPGSGSGDTVPAMLEPGEFVLRKSAVNALGKSEVGRLNKFASGGRVRELFGKFLGNGPKIQDQVKDLFSKGGFKRSLGLDDSQPLFAGLLSDNGYTSGSRVYSPKDKAVPSKNKQILNYARKMLNTLQKDLGVEFDKNIVSKLIVTSDIKKHTSAENASGYRGFYRSSDKQIVLNSKFIKNKNDVKNLIGHEFGHAVDQLAGEKGITNDGRYIIDDTIPRQKVTGKLSDYKEGLANDVGIRRGDLLSRKDARRNLKFSKDYSEYRYSAREGFAEVFKRYAQNPKYREILNEYGFDEILKLVSTPKRFAKGGGVGTDTVPALLTPGEFVVNKKSAQAFGYDNLKKVNKYAKGGIVDKIGSLGIGGAIFGPQLVAEGVKSAGLGDFSQLVGPLSIATAGLVAFSTILKKDTDSLEDHITALKEDLTSNKVTQSDITDEAKTRRLAGIKDIQTRPFRELKTEISSLKSKRAGLEKEFNNPNQKIADLAFNKAIKIDSKIESLKNNFIKNLPSTRANIRQDIGSYSQANKSFRDVDLEKLKLSRIKLEDELVKKQKQLAADTRSEKVGNIAAIGGSIAIAAGAGISSFSNANAVNGERKTGGLNTSTVGAIGGALQSGGAGAVGGAIVGAQLTAWLGPHAAAIGAALGAAAGAIYGGVSEFQRIESQLNQVDFTKKFDKFSTQINSVLSGKATPQSQRGNISDFAKTANQAFLTTTGDEFTTLKGQVGGSVEAISAYINKTLDANKSTDSLIKENEDLILLLSRFGNQSIKELEDGIKKEIDIRQVALKQENRYIKIQEENNRRLSAIFGISGSIGDAQRSVHNVNAVLDSLGQFADGLGIISTRFDFSALDDVGSSNLGDVTRQASLAGNLIGGPANGLAQDIISATKTVGDLPLLLNRLVNTNQFEGKDLGLELQDAFKEANTKGGKPQELDFAQKLILEKFEKVVGGTGNTTEFLKRFNENPVDVIKELQSAIDPMVSVFKENAPKIQSELDGYSEGLSKGTDRFLRALDGLIESIDIEDVASQMEAAFKGKTRSFDEAQSFDAKKLSELGGNSSVSELGNRLNAAQSTILRFQDLLSEEGDVGEQKALREAISKNVEEAEKVRRALEFSADVNSRLANVQQELEKITRTKELKKDLVKDFVFGDAQAKRNVTKGLLAAAQVDNNLNKGVDPFKGLSPELVEMARSTFERFGDSKLFNGQTGNERLDAVAKAKGFDVGKNTSEFDKLKASSDKILEDAKTAREILNKNLQSRNEEFLTGLSTRFDQFFANLNKSFIDRENKSKADERAVKDNKIAGIDINIDKLKSLQRMIGRGINLNEDRGVEQLKNNLSLGKEAKSIEDKKSEAGRLFRNLKDVSNRDLSGVLDNEKFKTVSRSLNGKTGDERTEIIGPALIDAIKQLNIESIDKKNQLEGNVGPETAKALTNFPDRIEKILKPIENNKGISTLEKEKTTYKADGGMVWKKRGSDTVPAMTTDGKPYMLTPGEMIMNTRAVGKYGPTLKKMNYAAVGGVVTNLPYDTMLKFAVRKMVPLPSKKIDYPVYKPGPSKKYGDGIDASVLGQQAAARKRKDEFFEQKKIAKLAATLDGDKFDSNKTKTQSSLGYTTGNRTGLNQAGIGIRDEIDNQILARRNREFFGNNEESNSNAAQLEVYKEQQKINSRNNYKPKDTFRSLTDVTNQVNKTWTPDSKNADILAANNELTRMPVLSRRDTSFADGMRARRLAEEKAQTQVVDSVKTKPIKPMTTSKENFSVGAKAKGFALTPLQKIMKERNTRENTGQSSFNYLTEAQKSMRAGNTLTPLQKKMKEESTRENDKRNANAPIKYGKSAPGQGFFNVQDKEAQPKAVAQPTNINPKIIEDFNKAVDKLAGTKLELAISGSLSINITDGALTDKVKEGFRVAVQQYTDDKITQAINQLIGDAGLAVVPRPVGRKEGK